MAMQEVARLVQLVIRDEEIGAQAVDESQTVLAADRETGIVARHGAGDRQDDDPPEVQRADSGQESSDEDGYMARNSHADERQAFQERKEEEDDVPAVGDEGLQVDREGREDVGVRHGCA